MVSDFGEERKRLVGYPDKQIYSGLRWDVLYYDNCTSVKTDPEIKKAGELIPGLVHVFPD